MDNTSLPDSLNHHFPSQPTYDGDILSNRPNHAIIIPKTTFLL